MGRAGRPPARARAAARGGAGRDAAGPVRRGHGVNVVAPAPDGSAGFAASALPAVPEPATGPGGSAGRRGGPPVAGSAAMNDPAPRRVVLAHEADFDGFRDAARRLVAAGVGAGRGPVVSRGAAPRTTCSARRTTTAASRVASASAQRPARPPPRRPPRRRLPSRAPLPTIMPPRRPRRRVSPSPPPSSHSAATSSSTPTRRASRCCTGCSVG
ncbi:MAG: hypothetical protein MZW92_19110 [Comamonadaceae bacterium]|nr:hypothetical protein [Comamonadaceae bacterium]